MDNENHKKLGIILQSLYFGDYTCNNGSGFNGNISFII